MPDSSECEVMCKSCTMNYEVGYPHDCFAEMLKIITHYEILDRKRVQQINRLSEEVEKCCKLILEQQSKRNHDIPGAENFADINRKMKKQTNKIGIKVQKRDEEKKEHRIKRKSPKNETIEQNPKTVIVRMSTIVKIEDAKVPSTKITKQEKRKIKQAKMNKDKT